ncbi:MAG: 3-keto-5-aminohexanoate cleavage protein [Nitrospirae bacterium]|nr:3-keto-5-aminohexanoate cleavage protein [Nitrospirota bacterium]
MDERFRTQDLPDKVVVVCALTGAQQGKEANPNLPEQPDEIIAQALDAWRAGASVVHIHARGTNGKATSDPGIFRRIVDGIRGKSDLVINCTTGGAVAGLPLEDRIKVVPELKPEIASFSVGGGSLLGRYDSKAGRWTRDQLVTLFRSYSEMERAALLFREHGTKPELEVYDSGFLNNIWTLREAGWLEEPLLVNFVMGISGECTPWTPRNLMFLADNLPPGSHWLVSAIGARVHFRSVAFCAALGGHVRVGMEDNVYIGRGEPATSNAQIVEKAVRICREIGREPATPAEARSLLGLKGGF